MLGFFEKFIFGFEAFSRSIRMGLSLRKLLISLQKNLVSSRKFAIWFLGLLPVHLESLVIIMKMGGDLGSNNKLKHREQEVCKTTYMTRVKVWERRPISFIFRLSIVLLKLFLINVFIEFCSHAAIFWRFVIFLGAIWFGNMSWHEPDLQKWLGLGAKKILVKNLVVGQKFWP